MVKWIHTVGSVLLFASAVAHAEACGPYRVAFYEFGSLYSKRDTGPATGIDKDIIDELVRRTACRLEGFLDSRIRTWTSLQAGVLDMTVSAVSTPEREEFVQFVPYIKVRNQLVVRSLASASLNTVEAFATNPKLRLGVVRGYNHGAGFEAFIGNLRQQGRVDEYADAEIVARVFAVGRVDGLISQALVWGPLSKKNRLGDKVRFLPGFTNDVTVAGLALSRSRVTEADRLLLTQGIEEMRADGTLMKIVSRYLPADLAASVLL